MADIVQDDDVAFDGEQNAKDAMPAAIEHLPQGDAKLMRFIIGDRMPLRHVAQLGDGFLQPREPACGGGRRSISQD